MDKKLEETIDKMTEGDRYSDEPEVKRLAARTGTQAGEEEKKQTYEDWVKSQPKTGMPIGVHKTKKRR